MLFKLVRFDSKGGVFRYTSFFYEKNFHSETLDFTSFLKIIEKKLNSSYSHLKKLCTFVRSIRHKT